MELDRQLSERARTIGAELAAGGDLGPALRIARELSPVAVDLGDDSQRYLSTLASLAHGDLTVARVVEPHLDAQAILAQAETDLSQLPGEEGVWGVYAAHGPGHHLAGKAEADGIWTLTGRKPWCSLARELSHAVITAHTGPSTTRAFALSLDHPGVSHPDDKWVSRGLSRVRSTSLELDGVPAVPVGGDGWYLSRPGFAWGGIGVAAAWWGAAAALRDTLRSAAGRREPDQIALSHLGHADVLVHAAGTALDDAARRIDAGEGTGQEGAVLAARVRAACADVAERLLTVVGHALGPGPLTGDEEHARRAADLTVYVRQHHAERDLARLGSMIREESLPDEAGG